MTLHEAAVEPHAADEAPDELVDEPEMSDTPALKRKRGKGAGGSKKHYSKHITPQMRVDEYPTEPFEARQHASHVVLWCNACGKPISHDTKSILDQHLKKQIHITGVARLLKGKQVQAAKKEGEVKKERQPVPLTGRQTTLDQLTQPASIRRNAQDDMVWMCLCSGIPIEKIDHSAFRRWLCKTTEIHGCIPVCSGDFPRQNIQRLHNEMLSKLRELVQDSEIALMFDEWTDDAGNATVAVIAITSQVQVAIDVFFLEGHGKACGAEHKEISGELNNTISRLAIDTKNIRWVICDEGSVMVAGYKHILSVLWSKSQLILCMAHKLTHVGRALQNLEEFKCLTDTLFAGSYLLTVPKNAARKRRWLNLLKTKGIAPTLPPKVGDTRWNAWADAAQWWCANIITWKQFIEQECSSRPERAQGSEPKLLDRHYELLTKRLVSTTIKVCFAADHTAPLMCAINQAQKDGVVGPLLYDTFMNALDTYKELEKTQKYSPRIEDLFKKLGNYGLLRQVLHKATKTLHANLEKALEDRKSTMDVLKELRVLHPNNLNMVSHSQSDYPIVFSQRADLSGAWATYCRMPPTSLSEGGSSLAAWWASQPSRHGRRLLRF